MVRRTKSFALTIGRRSKKIYVCESYRELGQHRDGSTKYVSVWRQDVTDQAIAMVYRHMQWCKEPTCLCKKYELRDTADVVPESERFTLEEQTGTF